ncbi:serine racemase VanT catalytic subunit [Romboutsia weinsteinii]|nr:serine racemase VanT catalytic subunit [Romboutsia weinsteinii]
MNDKIDINYKDLRSYREINLSNLEHNLREIENIIDDNCKVMAVVKADAYGHGGVEVSRHLQKLGVGNFAVASIDEAIELRKSKIYGEILVLGYTPTSRKNDLINFNITQTIVDNDYANKLSETEGRVKAHVKIDTGMNRLGANCKDLENIVSIYKSKNLQIEGTFSHLSRADSLLEEDVAFTNNQIERFYEIIDKLKSENIDVGKIHIQSSYAILNYGHLKCDFVRPGIILYGVSSSPMDDTIKDIYLKPVLSLKSKIALVKDVKKSETVGYGNNFTTAKQTKIATVTIGYADGYPRGLSKKNMRVLINGEEGNIVGNICMDQLMVDVTNIDNAKAEDIVTLIGEDCGKYVSIDDISKINNTINNETLTALGTRVEKIYTY